MSGPDDQERAKDLARLWQSAVVPLEDEDALEGRRARVVPTIGGVIGRAAESRKRERRFRRIAASLAVAASVLGAIGAGYSLRQHHAPKATAHSSTRSDVRAVLGMVTLMHESQQSVVKEAALAVGDSVSTAADACAEVALTDLVVARIAGSSEVDVVAPRSAFHWLRLDRGRLDAKVDDRPSTTPKLIVETPDVEVVVTGTVFEVDVARPDPSAQSVTRVSVTKGRVVVRRAGVEVAAVAAGQSWTSEIAAPIAVPVLGSTLSHEGVERSPSMRGSLTRVGRAEKVAGLPSAANLDDVQMGTLAQENALFQSAVEARTRGDDAGAADRLGRLLTHYPSSPLAGEARVERMRALSRAGRAPEAAREARRYLADHPDGFAREEAKRLVMPGQTAE
jgi:hypothetical protein